MNLTPLRELEPTPDEIARVRERAAAPAPRRRRGPIAVAAVAAASAIAFALPSTPSATSALRAAAAAAADQPGPADFAGYRYVEMLDRRSSPWGVPVDGCEPAPARPGGGDAKPCPMKASARFRQEGRQEIWVASDWTGTRRDHGSKVTEVTGDPELAATIRREFGRKPSTIPYVYGEGSFARAPLAELPTDPEALRRVLTAAHADGRWRSGGRLATDDPALIEFELARYTAHLLAEANATPALRSAAFGMLAGMNGVVDLGEVEDGRGRAGHGIELHGRGGPVDDSVPATLKVIFDPERGDVLSWGESTSRDRVERILLHTDHVRSLP